MNELSSDQDLRRVLQEARTIAVLGAHPESARPAHYVPDYLHARGYRILPVNSQHTGKKLWGEPVRATLSELGEPVDIVDVFRRADALDAHLEEILAMNPDRSWSGCSRGSATTPLPAACSTRASRSCRIAAPWPSTAGCWTPRAE